MSSSQLESGVASAVAIVTGAILFKVAFLMKNLIPSFDKPLVLLTVFVLYAAAFGLLIGGIAGIDIARWGSTIAYGVLVVLFLALHTAYLTKTGGEYLGTDGILFTRYSVDLLLNGHNPYSHSMGPAFELYPIDGRFVTYRTDASVVESISYPALSFLLFVPQAILGIPNLNLTSVFCLMVVLAFLVYESPPSLALVPFAVVFADPNLTFFSFGGVFDILWVLPILFAMKFWNEERWRLAAVFVGFAFAVKQTPWFVAPFLAIWLYLESESLVQFWTRASACLTAGTGAFLVPNLPFIVWDFDGWVRGTLTPIVSSSAPLVKQGSGLTLASVAGFLSLPKPFFTIVMLLALFSLLVVYALYFERLKWAAWTFPAVVLWFNYRSLQNYFIFFVPIAYYAALLKLDYTRSGGATVPALVSRLGTDLFGADSSHRESKNELEVNDD